ASDDPEFGKQYVLKNIVHQTASRLGQPMDIAAAVCFPASPLTDFMTGTTFRIDGGSTPTVESAEMKGKRIQRRRPRRNVCARHGKGRDGAPPGTGRQPVVPNQPRRSVDSDHYAE